MSVYIPTLWPLPETRYAGPGLGILVRNWPSRNTDGDAWHESQRQGEKSDRKLR